MRLSLKNISSDSINGNYITQNYQEKTNISDTNTNWNSKTVTNPNKKDNVSIKINFLKNNEVSMFSTSLDDIGNNKKVLKDIGCSSLANLADKAISKVDNINNSVQYALSGFESELNTILNDTTLTSDEKKSKVKLLEAKRDAVLKEANEKILAVVKITDAFLDIAPMFLQLKSMGVETNEIVTTLSDLISNINDSPSNFKQAKDLNELKDLKKDKQKNLFGNNSLDKLKNKADSYKEKEKEIKEKLSNKNINKEEKEKLQCQLQLNKEMHRLFESLYKQLENK